MEENNKLKDMTIYKLINGLFSDWLFNERTNDKKVFSEQNENGSSSSYYYYDKKLVNEKDVFIEQDDNEKCLYSIYYIYELDLSFKLFDIKLEKEDEIDIADISKLKELFYKRYQKAKEDSLLYKNEPVGKTHKQIASFTYFAYQILNKE